MEEKIINEAPVFSDTVQNKEKKRFDISRKDSVFAIVLLAASVILSVFGICAGFRAGFAVSAIVMIAAVTAYLWGRSVKIKVFPLICVLLAVATAISFAITSNGTVRFFGFAAIVLLTLVWVMSLVDDRPEIGDLGLFATIFFPIFELALPSLHITVASLFLGGGEKRKTLLKSLIGFALAIPVLFVVVPLLMASDAAFSGLAEKLVSNLALTVLKVALGVIIACFLISYCLSLKKYELNEIKESSFKGIDGTVTASFLAVISVCYLAYLFSQLAYFFSAFRGFLPDDYSFTPAEYARRGFFEMSIIAAINFAIIFTALLISAKKNEKIGVVSRIFCTFIGIFTLIIISTAISKMVLYIERFGMTVLRIGTSAFMIFLAIVFISLMLRLFIPKVRVIRTAFVTAGLILALLGNLNINSVIADYNYNAYINKQLESIDVYTIYELGDEGIPYLVKLADDKDSNVAEDARDRLLMRITDGNYYEYDTEYQNNATIYKITGKKYDDIGQFGFSRNTAYSVLDKYIKENPDILVSIHQNSDYNYEDYGY